MRAQLGKLRTHYLGFGKNPTGAYSERQLSSGAAYTVFAHAEIESYLEGWSSAIVDQIEARWKAGRYTRGLTALLTFREPPRQPELTPTKDVWSEPCVQAIRAHRGIIENNHGLKEAHICRMLVPLGFDVRKIDGVLLADLAAFASIRGNHAHQSYRKHLGQQFDPFDRGTKVDNLLTLLADFDEHLQLYFKSL